MFTEGDFPINIVVTYIPREKILKDILHSDYKAERIAINDTKFTEFNGLITKFESSRSRFAFSFFDLLGIPPYSYIIVNSEHPHINSNLRQILLDVFILRCPIFQTPKFGYVVKKNDTNIFCIFNDDKPDFIGHLTNKIHLFVKHEYILYTVLKVASLYTHFPSNRFQFKFLPLNGPSNLRPDDEDLYKLEMNGGITPTVVIYGSSDPTIMSELLRLVLDLFPDHEELGLMDTTGTLKLSPFNIRLNTLVSYAAGDRNKSSDLMLENIGKKGTNVIRDPPYTIPTWLDDMTKECTPAKKEDLNRHSQLFLGIDACDSDGNRIDYYEKCKDTITLDKKYCYVRRDKDRDPLDPRPFVGGRRSRARPKKVRSKRRKHTTKKRK